MGKYKDIWNRDNDGSHKEERSFIRYAIVATAVMVIFLFVKKDSVIRWVQAGFTLRRQSHDIELLEQRNAELDEKLDAMKTDRDTLEKFARENLGFAQPGDDVYLLDSSR